MLSIAKSGSPWEAGNEGALRGGSFLNGLLILSGASGFTMVGQSAIIRILVANPMKNHNHGVNHQSEDHQIQQRGRFTVI